MKKGSSSNIQSESLNLSILNIEVEESDWQKWQTQFASNRFNIDNNHYCTDVITTAQYLYINDLRQESRYQENEMPYLSYLGLPIVWPDGSTFGSCKCIKYSDHRLSTRLYRCPKCNKRGARQ
ncbi:MULTISPECIES: GAF domain-containing protein [unclassified Shewanella]|uniref:GAF domain-containing protein n=1 Tax=unclassified Shewanella TaxID=196818 RepID=UPI003FA3B46E